MLRVFIGFDPRQPVAVQVLAHSIWERASKPVSITRLQLNQLPLKRVGLTQFTFSRYIVPYLCGYEGKAVFMDADMLCLDDICKLEAICDPQGAPVCVVKNPALRFEWPSLMYFDNLRCKALSLDFIERGNPQKLEWAEKVGTIPAEWNHLVLYDKPRKDAKIVHYTCGIPIFPEVKDCEYAAEWNAEAEKVNRTVPWKDLMGDSIHAKAVMSQK